MGMQITVKGKNDAVKAETADREQAALTRKGEYEEGDKAIFSFPEKNRFHIIRVDDTMDEAFIYGAGDVLVYEIPFGEGKTSYNPKSFIGRRHYLTMHHARDYETKSYWSLAKNVMDQHKSQECYPHVHTNVETRGEAVLAVHNATDGVTTNLSHGEWPYESWSINMEDDAQVTLEFSRPVDSDRITLYTGTDFPHDNWWKRVTFTFFDGTSETVEFEKSAEPHTIHLERRGITRLTLGQLIKADDPSPFLALTQIEVHGREHEAALQSAVGPWDVQALYNNRKNIYSIIG